MGGKTPKYKMAGSPFLGRGLSTPTAWKEVPERDFQACFFMDFLLSHCSIPLSGRHKRDPAKPTLVLNLAETHLISALESYPDTFSLPFKWERVREILGMAPALLASTGQWVPKENLDPHVLFLPPNHCDSHLYLDPSQPTSLLHKQLSWDSVV